MREEMSVKGKTFMAIAALAAAAGLVVTGAASAGGGGAETKVTIKAPGGDVFGKVKSPRARCVGDRVVKAFRVKGAPGGGNDVRIGTDNADEDGDWSVGQPGNLDGKRVYAKAKAIQRCRGDRSRVIVAG